MDREKNHDGLVIDGTLVSDGPSSKDVPSAGSMLVELLKDSSERWYGALSSKMLEKTPLTDSISVWARCSNRVDDLSGDDGSILIGGIPTIRTNPDAPKEVFHFKILPSGGVIYADDRMRCESISLRDDGQLVAHPKDRGEERPLTSYEMELFEETIARVGQILDAHSSIGKPKRLTQTS